MDSVHILHICSGVNVTSMPKRCAAFGCRGNYKGEDYSPVVKFPKDDLTHQAWIDAMPNDPETLKDRTGDIYICAAHFDCEYVNIKGGKRPSKPPSIFPGIPKSCFRQTQSTSRDAVTAEARAKKVKTLQDDCDRIDTFDNFVKNIETHVQNYRFIHTSDDLTMFMTDTIGRKVIRFIHIRKVESNFGFLRLISVEKNGFEMPRCKFNLQKDCIIHRWSDVKHIVSIINDYENSYIDHLNRAIQELDICEEFNGFPNLQFIQDQLKLLSNPPKKDFILNIL